MNIRAAMAALKLSDLDHTAKMALVVLCCRADRHTGSVKVSASQVAADLNVHRNTAQSALGRAIEAGYLAVDKPPGATPVWRVTCTTDEPDLHNRSAPPAQQECTIKESLEKIKEEGGAQSAGENHKPNPAVSWSPDLPPNPWVLDEETGTVRAPPTRRTLKAR